MRSTRWPPSKTPTSRLRPGMRAANAYWISPVSFCGRPFGQSSCPRGSADSAVRRISLRHTGNRLRGSPGRIHSPVQVQTDQHGASDDTVQLEDATKLPRRALELHEIQPDETDFDERHDEQYDVACR